MNESVLFIDLSMTEKSWGLPLPILWRGIYFLCPGIDGCLAIKPLENLPAIPLFFRDAARWSAMAPLDVIRFAALLSGA
ncbi:hypothetical protein WM40_19600 [Robbsia andropogonis]|uniref:Uncharacterized protein n=1 Tax=Robbsia andropogonis TaxID=28092 RepID=A0A0F5JWK8_9BURK|nr:hypothetical protein [Robbsia andropogonis]KKB62090.1 hypothetical protein WM40_19600 [Robbsia andropogonis]MCP1117440.1 hypothetical protein [Robbsia andropogonis]MCP1126906.1 hypothetical protein [Robbsia andropogonis]